MQFARQSPVRCDLDVTPMLGVVFPLAIFLLAVLGLSLGARTEAVRLPGSEPARPPAGAIESFVAVQLTGKGAVVLGGREVAADDLRPSLEKQRDALRAQGRDPARATVILQADPAVPTGKVQELMDLAQQAGFQRFSLRARSDGAGGTSAGKGRP